MDDLLQMLVVFLRARVPSTFRARPTNDTPFFLLCCSIAGGLKNSLCSFSVPKVPRETRAYGSGLFGFVVIDKLSLLVRIPRVYFFKMGGQASKCPRATTEILRRAGENMNTKGLPAVHTEIVIPTAKRAKKFSICRCWKSSKFPYCDNIHQKLQKQGVNVGPAMLEIRAAPPVQSVGASSSFQPGDSYSSSSTHFLRESGTVPVDRTGLAALVGGISASVLAGGAHFAGLI
ncbi:putative PfMNL-2 CISD1 family iron-sulfur protein [Toxoplasma gondii RUB]|uniref:Putative PfMNL-2 CISD1 family iron-sulfur protein n=3 Tax=Toxoplasma gondii TaxID=5811 RepID=A0A086LLT6_TOXGO|nr:putative PfMNL-2 CISD1 family iron-sulfur protein [Toxoplasma gondii RUB]KFH01593.1 putative PfMNL-2 CISD1 family iron-sulfur protein [Toxoplasma gondii MAS]KFH02848.1 putative PfMNL-2 CISD1 family iron-sulfur protein [Toxoplasma gondii VAND]